ncbi:GNAT family N-acetyltransferase [Providencia alcalifaciens]|uniref:GNAT family N-acetyltransferase n=1 Tax=Providencia alcalifaciens TaxID=126385 RepID=UPI00029C17D0|nr:GNAT family N-acetyltransferase [Providencia alcalifaciens]EKT62635.1 GNAT-family acetyltransferase [Providencia alcalifaciens Dmel2]
MNLIPKLNLRLNKRRMLRDYRTSYVQDGDSGLCRAVYEDFVLGKAVVSIQGDELYLHDIVVHPLFRQQGIGSILIERVINQFLGSDVRCFKGKVEDKSVLTFYSKLGFTFDENGMIYRSLEDNSVEQFVKFEDFNPFTLSMKPDDYFSEQLASDALNLWLSENKALNIKIINIETEEDKSSSSIMRMGRSFQGIRVWYTTGDQVQS